MIRGSSKSLISSSRLQFCCWVPARLVHVFNYEAEAVAEGEEAEAEALTQAEAEQESESEAGEGRGRRKEGRSWTRGSMHPKPKRKP